MLLLRSSTHRASSLWSLLERTPCLSTHSLSTRMTTPHGPAHPLSFVAAFATLSSQQKTGMVSRHSVVSVSEYAQKLTSGGSTPPGRFFLEDTNEQLPGFQTFVRWLIWPFWVTAGDHAYRCTHPPALALDITSYFGPAVSTSNPRL